MFQRDKDLRADGRASRAQVLEKAKEQRRARAVQREKEVAAQRLQRFLSNSVAVRRARRVYQRDFDAKIADIDRLKTLLQRDAIPLPFDVLCDLLRKLLFFYSGSNPDQTRLARLCLLFRDSLVGQPSESLAKIPELLSSRKWLLARLVDLSIQAYPSSEEMPLVVVSHLVRTVGFVDEHITSSALRVFSPRTWQYSRMDQVCLTDLVRQAFITARGHRDVVSVSHLSELFAFAVDATIRTPQMELGFVENLLSIPLLNEFVSARVLDTLTSVDMWSRIVVTSMLLHPALPESPVQGIPSIVWLLGNLLWLSDRVLPPHRTRDLSLNEVELFSNILKGIPRDAFGVNGVPMAWTKVTDSHVTPVIYPEALTSQLQLITRERRIRQYCEIFLRFNAPALTKPLLTERSSPMNPDASTIHEQYGFGDIATSRSLQQSLSDTWNRVKLIGKATWAKKLLEKTGLKKVEPANTVRKSVLENTSHRAHELAKHGHLAELRKTNRFHTSEPPFDRSMIFALARFLLILLSRWPNHSLLSHRQPAISSNVLNVVSFLKLPVVDSTSDENIHVVTLLWSFLQEVEDFETFTKDVNLLHSDDQDGYIATLGLFCAAYNHLLIVLDDDEMYALEFPLPLRQLERIICGLKYCLHSAYWTHGTREFEGTSLETGKYVIEAATRLLRNLYSRCSRLPFCNVSTWVLPGLNSFQLIEEVLTGTPRANKLISSMPYIIPFPERVKLFHRLIELDKQAHQGDVSTGGGVAAYRVRIRRGAILEDGLSKLNVIRGNLKKKINVVFVNAAGREEVGIDAGGLFKEFWLDLANLAFDLQYGLFLSTPNDQLLYPNPHAASPHFTRESDYLTLFQFVGRILGKALYEGIVVEPKFAHFFLSKLLHSFNHLSDLPSLDPEIHKNLMFLKSYEGEVEDLGLTFTIVQDFFGQQKEVELLPNGANIAVTNANRSRYVHLVANYYLNTQIREQSAAFRTGLADLIDIRWLQLFNEPELQVLISGKSGDIDINDLKSHTKYAGGYYAMDKRVQWFWQALESFSPSEKAAFLRFATSCQRPPSLGFVALTPPFCIQKISVRSDEELLPSSSTCFNTLKLPTYSSLRVLRSKLLLSITSGAGFEMT